MRTIEESVKLADDLVAKEAEGITPAMAFQQMTEVLGDDKKFLIMLRFMLCMARAEYEGQRLLGVPTKEMTRLGAKAAESLAIHYYSRQDVMEMEKES